MFRVPEKHTYTNRVPDSRTRKSMALCFGRTKKVSFTNRVPDNPGILFRAPEEMYAKIHGILFRAPYYERYRIWHANNYHILLKSKPLHTGHPRNMFLFRAPNNIRLHVGLPVIWVRNIYTLKQSGKRQPLFKHTGTRRVERLYIFG